MINDDSLFMGVLMRVEGRVRISESWRRKTLQKFLMDLNICARGGKINLDSQVSGWRNSTVLFAETQMSGRVL